MKNHKTNREIDALIAEKVMDQTELANNTRRVIELDRIIEKNHGMVTADHIERMKYDTGTHYVGLKRVAPYYSTDISPAMEVILYLQNCGVSFVMSWDAHELDKKFRVSNYLSTPHGEFFTRGFRAGDEKFDIDADTAPMAICLAALRSKGIDV